MLHSRNSSYIFGFVIKNSTSLSASLAPLFVVLMLVLASCGKDPLVIPCSGTDTSAEKALSNPDLTGDPSNGNTRDNSGGVGGGEDGIGDDGDDISDTERNRKKR